MRAARYYGKEDIRIEEVEEQVCGSGQVRIAPAFVGICGTDLHEYLGGPTFCPVTPHPVTHESIPITLGHEFSGVVTELGPSSPPNLTLGQHVAVRPTVSCASCSPCTAGVPNICTSGGFIGLSGGGGGLSDSVVVPAAAIHVLPAHIPLDVGALVEPLAVAHHAAAAAPLTPDSSVLVLGGGPIGLALIQILRAKGVSRILVAEPSAARQRFARQFGASNVFDPRQYGTAELARQLSGGDGVDVVFDCAGVQASIRAACESVRARGTVVNVAIWEGDVGWNPNSLVFKEAVYRAVLGYLKEDFEAVVSMLDNGTLKPADMITSRIALEDVVECGIKALVTDKENHVKILVDVGGMQRVDSAVH